MLFAYPISHVDICTSFYEKNCYSYVDLIFWNGYMKGSFLFLFKVKNKKQNKTNVHKLIMFYQITLFCYYYMQVLFHFISKIFFFKYFYNSRKKMLFASSFFTKKYSMFINFGNGIRELQFHKNNTHTHTNSHPY